VLIAILAFAGMLYFRRGLNPPQAAPPTIVAQTEVQEPLGLSVERRGNDLRVTWNGHADIMSKADFGMLLIRGASVSRDVPLSAEELRAGTVVYSAPVDQTRFQLNVVAGGQVAREFLTVVMPQAADAAPNRASVPGSAGGNPKTNAVPRQPVSSEPAATRELKQFKPLDSPNPAADEPRRLDEPPPVGSTRPVNAGTPSLLNQPALSPIAPPVSQTQTQAQAPVSSQPPAELPAQRNPPVQAARSSSEALPPLPTHQVIPPLPPLLRGVLWKLTTVDVSVAVDASGNVTKAEAVAKPGLHPLLRDAAVQAARRWKFQPAQFNGHAVPANMVLQFNFAPTR
jgi:protein TonB